MAGFTSLTNFSGESYPNKGTKDWATELNNFFEALDDHDHSSGKGTQIVTGGIADNAVTEDQIRLTNDAYLNGRNAAGSADINLIKVNASDKPTVDTNLVIDATGTDDAVIELTIDATAEWHIGIDNSDSDKLMIGRGATPGTTTHMAFTEDGEITKPLQPAVLAYLSATASNVTGDSTNYTVAYDTEIYDKNADFNTSTYTFTAPVDGRYLISGIVTTSGITSSHTSGDSYIITSNRNYVYRYNYFNMAGSAGSGTNAFREIVDMDASDTAFVRLNIGGGTKVADVVGGASPVWSRVSIELLG